MINKKGQIYCIDFIHNYKEKGKSTPILIRKISEDSGAKETRKRGISDELYSSSNENQEMLL